MPLIDLDLSIPDSGPSPLPPPIPSLLAAADLRTHAFIESRLNTPVPGFVPSDFPLVYSGLRAIAERTLATGPAFCEWGSGLGVVACMAASLRFQACGIEIEPDLVAAAQRLAADFNLPVQFAHGSFIPHGREADADDLDGPAWVAMGGPSGYDALGLGPDDFDLIYAYPWPGEEHAIERWFLHSAATGAILLTYRGLEGLRAQRKVSGRGRR